MDGHEEENARPLGGPRGRCPARRPGADGLRGNGTGESAAASVVDSAPAGVMATAFPKVGRRHQEER
ncbi:hypothetical protein ACWG5P_07230 [Streptomyces prasinus]